MRSSAAASYARHPGPLESPRVPAFAVMACVALLVASAAHFLPHQSLWVDETTQLGGIALGAQGVMPWLMGQGPDLGVPPDRMPPLGYLLGIGWSALGLGGETGMRWFGVVCCAIGLAFTAAAARRAWGPSAALAAALFLALSPNVLLFSVEIRAYPVFLMTAGLGLYLFVHALQAETVSGRRAAIGVLVPALLLGVYVHFFGVVFASALIAALSLDAWRERRPFGPVAVSAGLVAALSAGLLPFIVSAQKISVPAEPAGSAAALQAHVVGLVKLVYRLYGHPAMALSVAATAVASTGFVAAIGVGALAGGSGLAEARVRRGVCAAAFAGLAIVTVAAFVVKGFDAVSPSYNVWMLPTAALLLARGVTVQERRWRRVAAAGVAMLLVGSAYATWKIHRLPDAFAHGPQQRLFALIDALGADQVDLVYDGAPDDAAGLIVFPVRYRYGRALPQYVFTAATGPTRFDASDGVSSMPARRRALVIRAQSTGAAELARLLSQAPPAPPPLPAAQWLVEHGARPVAREWRPGLVTAELQLLERLP